MVYQPTPGTRMERIYNELLKGDDLALLTEKVHQKGEDRKKVKLHILGFLGVVRRGKKQGLQDASKGDILKIALTEGTNAKSKTGKKKMSEQETQTVEETPQDEDTSEDESETQDEDGQDEDTSDENGDEENPESDDKED